MEGGGRGGIQTQHSFIFSIDQGKQPNRRLGVVDASEVGGDGDLLSAAIKHSSHFHSWPIKDAQRRGVEGRFTGAT